MVGLALAVAVAVGLVVGLVLGDAVGLAGAGLGADVVRAVGLLFHPADLAGMVTDLAGHALDAGHIAFEHLAAVNADGVVVPVRIDAHAPAAPAAPQLAAWADSGIAGDGITNILYPAIVGSGVRLYQHVTLGARSPLGAARRGPRDRFARHPIVGDDVVIYAGATILGRVTIGAGATIGGNVWLTRSVPPGSNVAQAQLLTEAVVAAAPPA